MDEDRKKAINYGLHDDLTHKLKMSARFSSLALVLLTMK